MGLHGKVVPNLAYARGMELAQNNLFPDWWGAVSWYMLTWIFWVLYFELPYHITRDPNFPGMPWRDMVFVRPVLIAGDHSLLMFASCYMIGPLLYTIKWLRGNEEIKLPKFMHMWLNSRKQLGLLAALDLILHVFGLGFMLTHRPHRTPLPTERPGEIPAVDQVRILFGLIATVLLMPILVTSLPNQVLMWKEWHFIHQILGNFLMVSASIHSILFTFRTQLNVPAREWRTNAPYTYYNNSIIPNPNAIFPAPWFSHIPMFVAIVFIIFRVILSTISAIFRGNPIQMIKSRKSKKNFAVHVYDL